MIQTSSDYFNLLKEGNPKKNLPKSSVWIDLKKKEKVFG